MIFASLLYSTTLTFGTLEKVITIFHHTMVVYYECQINNVYKCNNLELKSHVTSDHWDTLQHLMVPIVCTIIELFSKHSLDSVFEMLHCNLNWQLLFPSMLQ